MPILPEDNLPGPASTPEPNGPSVGLQTSLLTAPPSSWRPFRTLGPALLTYTVSAIVGGGLFFLILVLSAKSTTCSELVIFLCVGLATLVSAAASLVLATIMGIWLLRRSQVERAVQILLLAYVCLILLTAGLSHLLSLFTVGPVALSATFLFAGLALFALSWAFCDWCLNAWRGPAWAKLLSVSLAAMAGLAAIGLSGGAPSVTTLSATSSLRSDLSGSGLTLLVPPPNSAYPQPNTIAAQSNAAAQPDYHFGAYFGIDTGAQNGSTLYEYKVDAGLDPIFDCAKISSMLVKGYDGQTSCTLVTTLSTGTKIYGAAHGYGHQFFVIKNGLAAIYAPPSNMTDPKAYDFLDHLVPLEIDSFVQTLHQKNPMEY